MTSLKCRFCLEPHSPQEAGSFSILNGSFTTAIKRVFSFEIKSEQHLPDYACKVCSSRVWQFYTYSVLVENNQLKLQQECTMLKSTEPTEGPRIDGHKQVVVKSEPMETSTNVADVPLGTSDAALDMNQPSANEIEHPPPRIKLEPLDGECTADETIGSREDGSEGKTQLELKNDIAAEQYTITTNGEESNTGTTTKVSSDAQHLADDDGTKPSNVSERYESQDDEPCEGEGIFTEKSQPNPKNFSLFATSSATFPCDYCERSFSNRVQLNNHQRMHKRSECPICKKVLNGNLIKQHLAAHEGTFRCDICDTLYSSARSLRTHKDLKHAAEAQPGDETFPCGICERTFCNQTQQSLHRKVHNIQQCPICLKQVIRMNLQTHIAIHQGAHYCELCQKAFSSHKNLITHNRAKHTAVVLSDTVCEHCGLSFPNRAKLAVHRKAHQRKECPVCGKTFRPNKMKEHLASHAGAFRCVRCSKMFSTKYSLKKHNRTSAHCGTEKSDDESDTE